MLMRRLPAGQAGALAALAALLVALAGWRLLPDAPKAPVPAPFVVEAAGEVARPGVYLLTEGTAGAALSAAGGARCAPEVLALSRPVAAGDRLFVSCAGVGGGEAVIALSPMRAGARLALGAPLDLNATPEEGLLLVPGMRKAFASAIVSRRLAAPWGSVEELSEIPGIGPKTVQKWRGLLAVR